jgi:transcriptional regulator with XRE-family HTH domain
LTGRSGSVSYSIGVDVSALPRASQILLVGQKIRQIRKSRHLTQADLAAKIGVTQSDLSRMENGEYKVGLDTLFKILQVFELSMSRFFEEPTAAPEEAPVPSRSEREQLFADWEELPDDARREVCEFVAFKKMQAEQRRTPPQWKPEGPSGEEEKDDKDEKSGPTNA